MAVAVQHRRVAERADGAVAAARHDVQTPPVSRNAIVLPIRQKCYATGVVQPQGAGVDGAWFRRGAGKHHQAVRLKRFLITHLAQPLTGWCK